MRRLLLALCLLNLTVPLSAAEFKAGAHAEPITPEKFPAPINGNMKGGFANSVHDPMHARCLALHDGKHELILCVVDACMIPREICEQAKTLASQETGVPASHMLISATHTHSAATMVSVFQSDPDPEYLATLPARIARGIAQAHRHLEPAEIAWGKGSDPTQLFNRRWVMKDDQFYANPFGGMQDRVKMNPGYQNPQVSRPSGPTDPEVTIITARAVSDRRPLALFANYSLHYVGGNPAISADYFAAYADQMTQLLKATDARYSGKPAFVGIMSNGTSGDVNNVNFAGPPPMGRKPGEQLQVVARSVAAATLKAYDKLAFQAHVPLASAESDIRLKVRKANLEELAAAKQLMEKTPRDKDGQFSGLPPVYARETVLLNDFPDEVPVKLQVHRIGELSVAGIPCEVFTQIGLNLKQRSPFAGHCTVSLANGYNGYLPTVEQHKLGGYETWRARSSYLEVDAETKIVEQLLKLTAALK